MNAYVVAGIGTEVGKTVVAAVLVQALGADYWKPVQAGELGHTDSDRVRELVADDSHRIHPEIYRLTQPMSPHAAALHDQVTIDTSALTPPECERTLVIELAGGLMVPLAADVLNIDLVVEWGLPVILVSQYYLGSINHTLLSIELLRQRDIEITGLVFNGAVVASSRAVILAKSGLPCLLDLPFEPDLSQQHIAAWARELKL